MKTWFKQPPQHFVLFLFSFLVSLYIMLALFYVQASREIKVLYNFNIINLSLLDKTLGIFFRCHLLSMCNWTCSMNTSGHMHYAWMLPYYTKKVCWNKPGFDQNLRRFQDQSSLYSHSPLGIWAALSFLPAYCFCCRFGLPLRRRSLSITGTLQADPTG